MSEPAEKFDPRDPEKSGFTEVPGHYEHEKRFRRDSDGSEVYYGSIEDRGTRRVGARPLTLRLRFIEFLGRVLNRVQQRSHKRSPSSRVMKEVSRHAIRRQKEVIK